MNAGKLESSDRLQRVYKAIVEAGKDGITTADVAKVTRTMNPGCAVSELNHGFHKDGTGEIIICHFERTTKNGRRVYRYRYFGKGRKSA